MNAENIVGASRRAGRSGGFCCFCAPLSFINLLSRFLIQRSPGCCVYVCHYLINCPCRGASLLRLGPLTSLPAHVVISVLPLQKLMITPCHSVQFLIELLRFDLYSTCVPRSEVVAAGKTRCGIDVYCKRLSVD